MTLSAFALPCGHSGVLGFQLTPNSPIYLSNSLPLNGGPLSVVIFAGIPWRANILSHCGMTVFASVERTTSTSGYFE